MIMLKRCMLCLFFCDLSLAFLVSSKIKLLHGTRLQLRSELNFNDIVDQGFLLEHIAWTFVTSSVVALHKKMLTEFERMTKRIERNEALIDMYGEAVSKMQLNKGLAHHGLPFPILFFKYEPSPVDQNGNPVSKFGTLLAIDQYGNVQTSDGPFGSLRRSDWQGVVDSAAISPIPSEALPQSPPSSSSPESSSS